MSNIVKSNAIIPTNLEDLQRLGNMCATSGFFQDARQLAQACVKIAAGAEYGLPPVVSMTGINVIKGRVTLSANVMAAIMKRAGYKLKTRFDGETCCTITVIDPDGENLGESSFSMDDAKRAGLGGDNWKKFPRNMLFARAVSNAARWFAPEVLTGAITPEELGEVEEPPVIEVSEVEQRTEPAAKDKEVIIEARIEQAEEEEPEQPMSVETEMFLWRAERAAANKAEETPSDAKEVVISMQEVAQVFEKTDARTQAISEVGEQIRKTSLARIHAAARDVGLDHAGLKALLPSDWSLTTVPQATLDALSGLLSAKHLDTLREMWSGYKMPALEQVKDYMKARLSAKPALSPSVCKGEQCGKQILWGLSEKQGTRTPVELGPIRSLKGVGKGELFFVLTDKGTLLLTHTYPVQEGETGVQTYLSHHSTCPNAPHFRVPKKEAA